MRWPLNNFTLTQGFHANHQANDLAAPLGTPILAPEAGRIEAVNNDPNAYFGGNYIRLAGVSGQKYYMGHNNKNHVKVGQTVNEGQHIADVGKTGQATGPHIHFQIWNKAGALVDPSKQGLTTGKPPTGGYMPIWNDGDITAALRKANQDINYQPPGKEYDYYKGSEAQAKMLLHNTMNAMQSHIDRAKADREFAGSVAQIRFEQLNKFGQALGIGDIKNDQDLADALTEIERLKSGQGSSKYEEVTEKLYKKV